MNRRNKIVRYLLASFIVTIGLVTIIGSGGGGGGGGTPDTTPPTVAPGSPTADQTDVSRNTTVTAVFNEPMNSGTINTSTFTLEDNIGTPVAGAVSYSGVTATFIPATQLDQNITYTATVTIGAQDTAGNALASDVNWSFTTEVTYNIQVSWSANPETAVNRSGGGYKLYYSTNSGFNPNNSGVTEIDVPYSSGALAPTLLQIEMSAGTYYIRIAAYSALNPPGISGGSISTATPQVTLIVP